MTTPDRSDTQITTGTARPVVLDRYRSWVAAELDYRKLGWPVTLRRDEVVLSLDLDVDVIAMIIPAELATQTVEILTQRRCEPAVLAHPCMPEHWVILAGERYGVPLVWPTGVHRIGGTLLLPPTVTDRGPIAWVRPPHPHSLRLCREIDVFAALRAALSHLPLDHNLPPGEQSAGHGAVLP